jgi:predicted nucleotidyltransferase
MPNIDIQVLARTIGEELRGEFPDYRGVYFYGSRARGGGGEASDYDMVFLFEHKPSWREKQRAREIIYMRELALGIVIDSHFYAREEIEKSRTPFREAVRTEGTFYGV